MEQSAPREAEKRGGWRIEKKREDGGRRESTAVALELEPLEKRNERRAHSVVVFLCPSLPRFFPILPTAPLPLSEGITL